MFKRINIASIVKDHFRTLRSLNQSYSFMHWKDIFLFIILPLTLSIIITYNGYNFKQQVGNLIAATAIFGGFLFNLLAIIYGQINNIKEDAEKENSKLKKKFVKEIHTNISFCIVLSIFIVLSLLLTTIDIPSFQFSSLVKKIFIIINYYLMTIFVLTLMMVLKRVYVLLKKDAE